MADLDRDPSLGHGGISDHAPSVDRDTGQPARGAGWLRQARLYAVRQRRGLWDLIRHDHDDRIDPGWLRVSPLQRPRGCANADSDSCTELLASGVEERA